jgi:NADPH-dependent glutamate synthase beta subunit-like oxidoreductase
VIDKQKKQFQNDFRPRDLPIPNRNAEGIHFAMQFLQTWQQKQRGDEVPFEQVSAKGNK